MQELHFLLVSRYRGPFGGPVGNVGAEIALLDTSSAHMTRVHRTYLVFLQPALNQSVNFKFAVL